MRIRIVQTLALFLFFLAFENLAGAQDIISNKVYRVTGIKRGENSVRSMSNYAEVIPPLSIFIPNAFTPNGDGINDAFGVKGEGIRDFHMYIYNRWGEVIYESENPRAQWDGSYKGRPAQEGTYVVQVFAESIGKKAQVGSVTLVR